MRSWKSHQLTSHTWLGLNPLIGRPLSRIVGAIGLFFFTNRACCQSQPVEMFIEATMPRNKRNQNFELFFRQTLEVFGCLQLWVFNPNLRLSTAVDPAAIQCLECASMIHILFISRTIEADSGTQGSGPQKWESEPTVIVITIKKIQEKK
jgi:hypothetical protein